MKPYNAKIALKQVELGLGRGVRKAQAKSFQAAGLYVRKVKKKSCLKRCLKVYGYG